MKITQNTNLKAMPLELIFNVDAHEGIGYYFILFSIPTSYELKTMIKFNKFFVTFMTIQ
jgi:hypothetical protein